MRKSKRVLYISLILFLIFNFIFINRVHANELNTILQIVQSSSETKELPNEQGFLSKAIIGSDLEKGEVIIELKLSNIAKETESDINADTEILIVFHISLSMDAITPTGESRLKIAVDRCKNIS
jgi:hypothetical protein